MRGSIRPAIKITIPPQENLTYNLLVEAFSDGAKIIREETTMEIESHLVSEGDESNPPVYEDVEVPKVQTYDLTQYNVAGDIIDKRDGSFEVYMGEKTELEILNEDMASVILELGGAE